MLAPMEIPETKPATELIDGRLVQKMSPKWRHQELELRWTLALRAWAGERGERSMSGGTSFARRAILLRRWCPISRIFRGSRWTRSVPPRPKRRRARPRSPSRSFPPGSPSGI